MLFIQYRQQHRYQVAYISVSILAIQAELEYKRGRIHISMVMEIKQALRLLAHKTLMAR